jgi:hypothetical protein
MAGRSEKLAPFFYFGISSRLSPTPAPKMKRRFASLVVINRPIAFVAPFRKIVVPVTSAPTTGSRD